MRPLGRGTFQFQTFILASSPEIWSETISGGEEVLAGSGVACFELLLRKNFRRRVTTQQAATSSGALQCVSRHEGERPLGPPRSIMSRQRERHMLPPTPAARRP